MNIRLSTRPLLLWQISFFFLLNTALLLGLQHLLEGGGPNHLSTQMLWAIMIGLLSCLGPLSAFRWPKYCILLLAPLTLVHFLLFFEKSGSKSVLFIALIYLGLFYYFVQLYLREKKAAYYHPCYEHNDMSLRPEMKWMGKLLGEGQSYNIIFSNWGENGAFVKILERNTQLKRVLKSLGPSVTLELSCFNQAVRMSGRKVSETSDGIGLRFEKGLSSWDEVYLLLEGLGPSPQERKKS